MAKLTDDQLRQFISTEWADDFAVKVRALIEQAEWVISIRDALAELIELRAEVETLGSRHYCGNCGCPPT